MARKKEHIHVRKLPLGIKNLLRGSKSVTKLVSRLRSEIESDLFLPLVQTLPHFVVHGRSAQAQFHLPPVGFSIPKFRVDIPLLEAVSFERELLWAAAVFTHYAPILNRFVDLKAQLERNLLAGKWNVCQELLLRIEDEFGFSFWFLDIKIALLQSSSGLEAQKAFSARTKSLRPEGDLIPFLAAYISWRNEDTTNPFVFRQTVRDRLSEWTLAEPFRVYLALKLTGECTVDERTFSELLRHEASYSLIDYYESFVRLAMLFLSEQVGKRELTPFVSPLVSLTRVISDFRLSKMLSLTSEESLARCGGRRSLEYQERLVTGDYEGLLNLLATALVTDPGDGYLWCLNAIAEVESNRSVLSSEGLGQRLVRVLRAIIEKRGEFTESVWDGARLMLNYRSFPFAGQFEAFFGSELSSMPKPMPAIQLAAFLSSPYVEAHALRFLPSPLQVCYANFLTTFYGNHSVVALERWRAQNTTGTAYPPEGTDRSLLYEIRIEHAAASGQHEEALRLARQLAERSGQRYTRIAKRWIAECLLRTGSTEEAIEYVCSTYLSDPHMLSMLPVKECAFILDKKRRSVLAGRLSTPIMLDLYTRKHDFKYASERNYAYEDFLLAHGLEKPSQLRTQSQNFDQSMLLYYLRLICVPEVMQDSTAFDSSRELDEERLAVCAILADIDPDNLEEYEQEIRDITRQLVIRRGVRAVEQSKLFVDMSAIRRWADKNLKESFARYQALRSIGLDAGGAGIDNAVRDLLAGTPISEEYLHLPANETSQLLVDMLSRFLAQCLTHPEHGLDCYLSMRIRHGALAGQLRAPLEQEKIISQREGPLDEYKPNEFWIPKLISHLDVYVVQKIDTRLRRFSAEFDSFVDRFASEYIQVRSADKQEGIFHLPLTVLLVRFVAAEISAKTTFEGFLDICSNLFWEMLDACLHDAHQLIDRKLRPELTHLFESLRSDLNNLDEPYAISELDAAILNAQTRTQQKLEQVKDWFQVAKTLADRTFTFEEIVDIGLECVTNVHPGFRPRLTLNVSSEDSSLRFKQLSLFSDIFFIVFDNIRKHSGMASPKVTVSAAVKSDRLEIEIINKLSPAAVTPEREARVAQIREAIGQDGYLRAVRSEGGTGLKKLRNILRQASDPTRRPEFGFSDDTFFIRFDLKVLGIITDIAEHA